MRYDEAQFMGSLKPQIQRLRKKGWTYSAIARKLSCSTSVISHYLSSDLKKKNEAENLRRNFRLTRLKLEYGGECLVCGYSRCLGALEFDHLHPKTKKRSVSSVRGNYKKALLEAQKCVLLCCRCHRERHLGILDLGAYLEPSI